MISPARATEYLQFAEFGPCDSSLFEPCPHCDSPCEEMDAAAPSPLSSEVPSSPTTGLPTEPTLALFFEPVQDNTRVHIAYIYGNRTMRF